MICVYDLTTCSDKMKPRALSKSEFPKLEIRAEFLHRMG